MINVKKSDTLLSLFFISVQRQQQELQHQSG